MRGAPVSLLAQFKRFFDCGRVVRCLLPFGAGRFMHLVVLYGYQGADTDPEQLVLTDHLFDAALGELSVVVRGQPCMLVGDFNVKGFRLGSGLIWRFPGLELLLSSLLPPVSVRRVLVVVIVVISLLVALLLLLLCYLVRSKLIGGLPHILLSGPFLTVVGGPAG